MSDPMTSQDVTLVASIESGVGSNRHAVLGDADRVGERVRLDYTPLGRVGNAIEIAADAVPDSALENLPPHEAIGWQIRELIDIHRDRDELRPTDRQEIRNTDRL